MTPARNARSGKGKRGKVSRIVWFLAVSRDDGKIHAGATAGNGRHRGMVAAARVAVCADLRELRRAREPEKYDLVRRVVTDTVIG